MAKKDTQPPARSLYRGLRLTVTQPPDQGPSVLTLAVKHPAGKWDEWNLLFPALRIPHRELDGYEAVLRLVAETVATLLTAEEESR